MVARTQFAITSEDTRYFLNGAQLVLTAASMTLVATDGHRLALVTVPREWRLNGPSELKVILPKKTLMELSRLLGEGDEAIQYEQGENHLFFHVGDRLLISRKIDGQFPAYERVIPKGNDKRIEFERDRVTSAIKRVALLSNERSRAVKLLIDGGKVEVTSSSPEFGEAKEQLNVEYSGPAMQICFNAQYVLDFLSVVETDADRTRVEGRGQPGADAPGESAGGSRIHLRDHADAHLRGAPLRQRVAGHVASVC